MRFSLITATYNSAQTLERCLKSVNTQNHQNLEHLIVDGGSTDGTIEILKKYLEESSQRLICSEPDHSLYEAWNKAVGQARGDWVLFLGSDDWITRSNSLAMAADAIRLHPNIENCDFVCGHTVGKSGEHIGLTPSSWAWSKSEHWWNRWRGSLPLPAHPGVLHRASIFSGGASFDASYRVCADQKLLWQNNFAERHCWIDVELVNHQPGGISQNKSTARLQLQERRQMLAELDRPRPSWMEPLLAMKEHLKYFNY